MGKGRHTRTRRERRKVRVREARVERETRIQASGELGPPSKWRGTLSARGSVLEFPLTETVQSDGQVLTPGKAQARLLERALRRDEKSEPS